MHGADRSWLDPAAGPRSRVLIDYVLWRGRCNESVLTDLFGGFTQIRLHVCKQLLVPVHSSDSPDSMPTEPTKLSFSGATWLHSKSRLA